MTDADDTRTETFLAGLHEAAPPGLAQATLVAVGLADDYAIIDSPVGPLRVAWNGRGVSEVSGETDDEAFEARFRARTGRRARRVAELPADLARRIERRLAGDRRNRIDLDLRGSTAVSESRLVAELRPPEPRVESLPRSRVWRPELSISYGLPTSSDSA